MGLPARFLLLALLFSICILPVAQASVTISFAPVGFDPQDLQVYNSSGAMIGLYNTTSTAIILPDNSSYNILIMPWSENTLSNDPSLWFSNFVQQLQNHAAAIIILLFIVALLIAAIRRR
jgi:type 1 fimbria pilin